MPESRALPDGLANEDEQVALNPEPEFRSSKPNLSKSKEKVSADGAEEKLLTKEDEAKIVTRVDMADAKYTHSNGDTKIELDANKRQFSGLTKEELLKYADDPFWVNLRWFMFVLFWAMWVCMLAGAIAIIVRAPKCAPPTPRTWYEKGPFVDFNKSYTEVEPEVELPALQASKVEGMFVQVPDTYEVLDDPDAVQKFKSFVENATTYGVKVIVDLIPNFVSTSHRWFALSVNRTAPYADYFVWANASAFDETNQPKPPNNWVSTLNAPAWTYNEQRKQFYLHQFAEDQPDLDFNNEKVVQEFANVLDKWIQAGAGGVRLIHGRLMVVNTSLGDETPATGRGATPGAGHSQYTYYRHSHTADLPALDPLLATLAQRVPSEAVFTLKEDGDITELYLLDRNLTALRPVSAAPIALGDLTSLKRLSDRVARHWPFIQLSSGEGGEAGDGGEGAEADHELAVFAQLLPAAPVLAPHQLGGHTNNTVLSESLSHLVALRHDASIEHGLLALTAVPAAGSQAPALIACARWKAGHTGYVSVYNPTEAELRANLTGVASVPDTLTVHHVSHAVRLYTNYTQLHKVKADDALVPPRATIVLSYVPKTTAEN